MHRYDHSTPRAILGLTAVVMATITMSAMVVLPAKFDSIHSDPTILATAKTKAPIAVEGSQACADESEALNERHNVLADRAPAQSLVNRKFSWRSLGSI